MNTSKVITGRICRRQLCRYFVYSRADFGVFRPAGATRCTDQGQTITKTSKVIFVTF